MIIPTIHQMYVLTILNRELNAQPPVSVCQMVFERFGVRIELIRVQQILWHLKARGMVRFKNGDSLAPHDIEKTYQMTALGMEFYQNGVNTYRTLAACL